MASSRWYDLTDMDDIIKQMRRRELKQVIKKATIAGIISFPIGYCAVLGTLWLLSN
jgi:hypothetical protein